MGMNVKAPGNTQVSSPSYSFLRQNPAQAWQELVDRASQVTVKPGDSLSSIAKSHGETLAEVEAANPDIVKKNPDLIYPGQTVHLFGPGTKTQIVPGVSNDQLKEVVTAAALANASDPNWSTVRVGQGSWNQVQTLVYNMLVSNFKNDPAGAINAAQTLIALEPNSPNFAKAVTGGLQAEQKVVPADVRADGAPVMKAYEAYEAAKKSGLGVEQARQNLQAAIEADLNAAGAGAKTPAGRVNKILARELFLESKEPNQKDFNDAVDAADTSLLVTQPAKKVADAYASGGADAAAAALNTETGNTDPVHAKAIIDASSPTIQKIGADLAAISQSGDPRKIGSFTKIYGNLSASVEHTDHGTNPKTLGTCDTATTASKVAALLAGSAPAANVYAEFSPWTFYGHGMKQAIGNGQGATLSLALTQQLSGKDSYINDPWTQSEDPMSADPTGQLIYFIGEGYNDLKTRTDTDVQKLATDSADLNKAVSVSQSIMSKDQINAAIQGYYRRHPDFPAKYNADLGTVRRDGDAIVAAQQALNTYQPGLSKLPQPATAGFNASLAAAGKGLTGDDENTLFAVSQSSAAVQGTLGQIPGASEQADSGSMLAKVIDLGLASHDMTAADVTGLKSVFNAAGRDFKVSAGLERTLSGSGMFFTAAGASLAMQDPNSFADYAKTFYMGLGFTENAARAVVSTAANETGARALTALGINKEFVDTLANWDPIKLADAEALAGAFTCIVSLGQAVKDGDWTEASISAGGATGYLLTNSKVALTIAKAMPAAAQEWLVNSAGRAGLKAAGSGLLGDAAAVAADGAIVSLGEDAAASLVAESVLGPVGATLGVATAAGEIIYGLYTMSKSADERAEAQAQFENVYAQFLVDGAQVKPTLAVELASGEDGGVGPTEALTAYANHFGIKPAKLIQDLNGANYEFAGQFIQMCQIAYQFDTGPMPGSAWASAHQYVVDSYGANSPLAGHA
jgi:hypothetical protein